MRYVLRSPGPKAWIMVVGCGGTGSFVAEGLCRLLVGTEHKLVLVDHDRVEEGNLGRQNFKPEDLGRFKSQALAERLAREYGLAVDYTVKPIEQLPVPYRSDITIGCVDNPAAREVLRWAGYDMGGRYSYARVGEGMWYIDAGNGRDSGQVLIGNALLKEMLRSFVANEGRCHRLPLPTIQAPQLLAPAAPEPEPLDCAGRVAANEQSPVINQMMASLVLTFVHKLLTGTLAWMGAYIDLETGTLSTVPATPEAVSRVTGYTVKQLEYRPRVEKK